MNRFYLVSLVIAASAASPVAAAPPPTQTLKSSVDVLDELAAIPLKSIPPALLAEAQGVAIIPHVIKAGFIFGGRGGHGVIMVRDSNGIWSEPTFVNLGGASVGFQAGVESTDVVLVFRTRKSVDRLMEGKHKITLGVDAAVAAGPVGRQAAAATDARLEAEIVSYSRSRGLFAGVSFDGAAIYSDAATNAAYRRDVRPETAKLADTLKLRLTEMSSFTPKPGPRIMQPAPIFLGPPIVPVVPPAMPAPAIPPSVPSSPPVTASSPPAVPSVPPLPTIPVVPVVPVVPGKP
ncbi:MAG TPA: lipid-binding SYLF domain-containing protein [Gemmata sp.]|jgi:lipid-binding SYLF domain-containing protein|nr:lipid-binding SYLF domain-containing protein [Gemmata sp.]